MEQIISNLQQFDIIKLKISQHIHNRQRIKQMYKEKGIQMLQKEELVFSDINEPELKSIQNKVYQAMKIELSQKGYDEFRFLGQGAQGLVVLAKEKSTNKRYAIKGIQYRNSNNNIDPVIYDQVQKEIKTLNQCQGSPYVVNLLRQIEGNEFIFLVLTECLGTLNEIIQKTENNRLNELSAIKYAKDIAEGLYFIHSKNCLVNDLKMDNILIDYNGNAVVSDFGFANHLVQQSGYSIEQYKGNIQCQAPECYDPKQFDIYSKEYQKLGIAVKQEPSQRSEACSLGYLIYVMISGFKSGLLFNKHKPLQYDEDFQSFIYEKQLRYVIDGLTKFVPRERLKIKEVLIILKGIISLEFDLDSKFIEVMDDSVAAQKYINSFKKDVEYVQGFQNNFYPIIKNEKDFVKSLSFSIGDHKQKNESDVEELKQQVKELQQIITDMLNQQDKLKNPKQNIQPFTQNQIESPDYLMKKYLDQNPIDQFYKQKVDLDLKSYQQNLIQLNVSQQLGLSTKQINLNNLLI